MAHQVQLRLIDFDKCTSILNVTHNTVKGQYGTHKTVKGDLGPYKTVKAGI
jgi:hypothetical protein